MKPEKLSVLNLFENSRRYIVPLYQRAYVWSEERQWTPLWRDVKVKAETHLDAGDAVRRDDLPSHFLGAIVLEPQRVGLREVPSYDVIDGQQRLTTLQVFLAAFRDAVLGVDETIYAELDKATRNSGMMRSDVEVYKVWPTNFDREAFVRVMNAGSQSGVAKAEEAAREAWRPVPRLVLAYLFFAERIKAWIEGNDDGDVPVLGSGVEDRVTAMFFALRDNLQVVAISLEKGDDPQVIFETLNARGEPLLASDLVRNYVFTAANREELDTDSLYERYWRPFDGNASTGETFWRGELRIGREKYSRLVLFLYHFLTYKLGEDLSFATVFTAFKRWWENRDDPRDVVAGLRELTEAAEAYKRILEPSSEDRFGVFAHRLKALDVTTLHPLLLYLQLEAQLDEEALAAVVKDLESFLVRRWVCGLTTKNYNRFFLSLIEQLRSSKFAAQRAVHVYLLAGTGDSVRWPSDAEFQAAWLGRPVYKRARKVTGPVLQAIDAQLMNGLQESLHLKENPTIEHVMPQSWEDGWAWPSLELATAEETAAEVRDRLLHTFGNLTLLTGRLNRKVSNGAYEQKRPEIARQSALRLNTWFQDQPSWDDFAIRRRGEKLFEVARAIWPVPEERRQLKAHPTEPAGVVAEPAHERRAPLDPQEQLQRIAERLAEVLPAEFEVDAVRKGYVKVIHREWPAQVHYEVLHDAGAMRTELHIEFPKSSLDRERLIQLLRPLPERLADAYPVYEQRVYERTWFWFGFRLPVSASCDEVIEALQRVVMTTRAVVSSYFQEMEQAAD